MMYTADTARVRVRTVRRRLYVQWLAVEGATWHDLRISFKTAFPGRGDKAFCPSTKGWSVPRYRSGALWVWLTDHFAPDAIDGIEQVEGVHYDDDDRMELFRRAQRRWSDRGLRSTAHKESPLESIG